MVTDDQDSACVYCSHPIDQHGTDQIGCSLCGCGADPDWHPCPLGDEKGDE